MPAVVDDRCRWNPILIFILPSWHRRHNQNKTVQLDVSIVWRMYGEVEAVEQNTNKEFCVFLPSPINETKIADNSWGVCECTANLLWAGSWHKMWLIFAPKIAVHCWIASDTTLTLLLLLLGCMTSHQNIQQVQAKKKNLTAENTAFRLCPPYLLLFPPVCHSAISTQWHQKMSQRKSFVSSQNRWSWKFVGAL